MKKWYLYILSNKRNGTLYAWVTSDLERRYYQHKNEIMDGFSRKYGCKSLVYYEVLDDIRVAIEREKYIKWKKRSYKIELIEKENPNWNDLWIDLFL